MTSIRFTVLRAVAGVALIALTACTSQPSGGNEGTAAGVRDPFLAYFDTFGFPVTDTAAGGGTTTGGGAQPGTLAAPTFRQTMTLTFRNTAADLDLRTRFIAWVELGSVTSGEEQDALLENGYAQTARPLQIGSVFSLPVGTFIFNGQRTPFPHEVNLGAAGGNADPTTEFNLITPDVILVFLQPPVSCDSVGFEFSDNGVVAPGSSTDIGGRKTLAQFDVYQCDPLRPGLFYRSTGGTPEANEYTEGASVSITFSPATAGDAFATVSITR
jgi:hypothetical protein